MIELHGQVTTQRLHGQLNVVPNEGSTGGPLQSKTVHPSHDEQIITPDEDYYGLAVVKVEPVPRVPACFADTGYQLPNVVETKVNIGAEVSVTAEKYYTHFLYNGVRLPRIPDSVLASYPYAWIRNNTTSGYYDLMLSDVPFYYLPSDAGVKEGNLVVGKPWYRVLITTAETVTAWENNTSNNTFSGWGIDSARTVLWSNHDIPNGPADATEIYFAGSEPVPIE